MFSVINGVLLGPSYPGRRIVHRRRRSRRGSNSSFSFAEVADYKARRRRSISHRVRRLDVQRWPGERTHRDSCRPTLPTSGSAASRAAAAGRDEAKRHSRWRCSPMVTGSGCSDRIRQPPGDPRPHGEESLIVGVLSPSALCTARKQDFYVNYAANDPRECVDAGRTPASDDRRLRAARAGSDDRRRPPSCGRSSRGCTTAIPGPIQSLRASTRWARRGRAS